MTTDPDPVWEAAMISLGQISMRHRDMNIFMVNNGWMAETDDRRLMCFVEKPEALVRMLELAEQEGWI